jgi:hypothetical protein
VAAGLICFTAGIPTNSKQPWLTNCLQNVTVYRGRMAIRPALSGIPLADRLVTPSGMVPESAEKRYCCSRVNNCFWQDDELANKARLSRSGTNFGPIWWCRWLGRSDSACSRVAIIAMPGSLQAMTHCTKFLPREPFAEILV